MESVVPQGSRHRRYPLIGALLALGSPLGFLLVHALGRLHEVRPQPLHWLEAELLGHAAEYTYVTLSTLCVMACFGWYVGRLQDQLATASWTDALTGLGNRRYLDERMRMELARARRYHTPLSLLLIDVDRLKQINDQLGHAGGDVALRTVGDAVARSCRDADIPARYGGDEFAVLTPSTARNEAAVLGQRIRELLAAAKPSIGRVTVSIGIADLSALTKLDAHALCTAADSALYAAKDAGRDCISFGDGSLTSPPSAASSAVPPS